MTARLTFLGIVGFWITMNVLLWRSEFGARGGDIPVPLALVWKKVLTAPDPSSLSVYQNGERMGYCELSTAVGQQMANYDEDKLPPEGLAARSGYQIHLAGNVSLGDFTNRMKFDGRVQFNRWREWQELNLKVTMRYAVIEIHSLATNQIVHVKLSNEGTTALERDFAMADLQNPSTVINALTGNFADGMFGGFDLSEMVPATAAQNLEWTARRTRVKIGSEAVPVYRVETTLLGHPITADISTLGEVLRIELPDNISARIDEWSKP